MIPARTNQHQERQASRKDNKQSNKKLKTPNQQSLEEAKFTQMALKAKQLVMNDSTIDGWIAVPNEAALFKEDLHKRIMDVAESRHRKQLS